MTEQENATVGRLAEGNFQITMQLSQQRNVVVSGYLYADDTKAERDARVDRAQDLIDRQFIRCDIVNKRAQIKAQLQGIEQFRDQLSELQRRQEGRRAQGGAGVTRPTKLSSQELLQLQNGQQTIDAALKNIERLEAEIAAAEKALGTP